MSIAQFIMSAGTGALLCGVLVAVINGLFNRGNNKADAARELIQANKEFTNTVTAQYLGLFNELVEIKKAINVLTEVVDEVLPEITGLSPEQKKKLKDANNAAKLIT